MKVCSCHFSPRNSGWYTRYIILCTGCFTIFAYALDSRLDFNFHCKTESFGSERMFNSEECLHVMLNVQAPLKRDNSGSDPDQQTIKTNNNRKPVTDSPSGQSELNKCGLR